MIIADGVLSGRLPWRAVERVVNIHGEAICELNQRRYDQIELHVPRRIQGEFGAHAARDAALVVADNMVAGGFEIPPHMELVAALHYWARRDMHRNWHVLTRVRHVVHQCRRYVACPDINEYELWPVRHRIIGSLREEE
jgi:hypothetical protein